MGPEVSAAAAGGTAAVLVAAMVARVALRRPPESLQRTNVNGARVPAVLGIGVLGGALSGWAAGAAWLAAGTPAGPGLRPVAAAALVAIVMGAGGLADDLRGDERSRGFRGHLAALREGRVTGGAVKIAAGLVAGAAAALVLTETPASRRLLVALLVPLTANLVNLLDRAPGRASKVALTASVPLALVAPGAWPVALAPIAGAAVATLPADLRERGMLGDLGANALGGVVGLVTATALPVSAAGACLIVVGLLNALSERVSFSRVIESTPPLRLLDRVGRVPPAGERPADGESSG